MDERLRQLERAARADANDLAAGRALVRALDQAGDAVGAWRARCRLARAGDDDAWAELARLPGGAAQEGEPVERALEGRAADVDADARTVVVAGSSLDALDGATLEPRWSVAGRQDVARLVGPFVAHAPEGERTLVLRDAARGEVVARTALPAPAVSAAATLDRLIVTCADGPRAVVVVVDLGDEPGAPVAVRPDVPPFRAGSSAGRGLRVVYEMAGIADVTEARHTDTDVVAWRSRDALCHASDLGFVVLTRAQPRRLRELDPVTGAVRWEVPLDWPQAGVGVLLTPELAVASAQVPPWRDEARRFNVAAFDRTDGALRWTGGEEDVRWSFVRQASAATHAYFVRSPDEGPAIGELRVEARDLRTGALAWSRPLGLRRGDPVELHAVEGGVVVGRHDGGRTTLVRLGGP